MLYFVAKQSEGERGRISHFGPWYQLISGPDEMVHRYSGLDRLAKMPSILSTRDVPSELFKHTYTALTR